MITFQCPNCTRELEMSDKLAGQQGNCFHCGDSIVVPTANREPAEVVTNEIDGTLLGLVPEGEFLAGPSDHDTEGDDPFLVTLPTYYLAMHPVTNTQYKRFVNATGHRTPQPLTASSGPPLWEGTDFIEEISNHPVVYVNWDDAQTYCEWAGLRLPSELEWEKASRGTDGRVFPWGDHMDWKKCRSDNSKGCETTSDVKSYPKGCSPFGHFQMSGNIWEWCADFYDPYGYAKYKAGDLSPAENEYRGGRVVRGGSWRSFRDHGFHCAFRTSGNPTSRDSDKGFRCARSF